MTNREQSSPIGYYWYNGELIPIKPQRLTTEEQLELLDTHPLFTGVCPQCGYEFPNTLSKAPWDCPSCGWTDSRP